jgi:hypothetical protein
MRLLIVAAFVVLVASSGCKKKTPAASSAPAAEAAPPVDDRNTSFRRDGSTVGNAYRAGKRAVALNDMSQLGQLIEIMYGDTNKMPDAAAIKTAMQKDAPNLYKQIDEGSIILTGTKDHAGMWAYEVDADKAGGIVLVAGTASRASADDVKQHLGK